MNSDFPELVMLRSDPNIPAVMLGGGI